MAKRTDYIDRTHLRFHLDTTRKAILEAHNIREAPPVIVPASRWTNYEWDLHAIEYGTDVTGVEAREIK